MSLSVTSQINRTLPTSDVRPSSVIKRSGSPTQEPPRAEFGALLASRDPESTAAVVTPEEKQFFASMFPKASEEIRTYAGYSPSGMRQAVQLGTLIDKKG